MSLSPWMCAELPVLLAHPSRELGRPRSLWLQSAPVLQGSDADKSEDNLVVDEVSAGMGLVMGCAAWPSPQAAG